jgi:dolichyl-phosphate beta-glucosyltransferase
LSQSRPRLAVVIPAYNEEPRLLRTLTRCAEYFDSQPYSYRVTIVSDGSTDGTNRIANEFAARHEHFRLLAYEPNRGKGYAVRKGMTQVEGDLQLFADADLATPIEEVEKVWAALDEGADIAIGSRPLRESQLVVRQPFYREWLGRAFNRFVQLLGVPGIHDTQCGFKLFKRDAAHDVFERCTYNGFSFDIEALYIARLRGYRIAEVPIVWAHQPGSKVSLLRDGVRMTWDLVKLRMRGGSRYVAQPNEH